jgi:hypothetical protein
VILYNTLMGVCAGLVILLTVDLIRKLKRGETPSLGYGAAYLLTGVPLTVLAGAMTLTWPLTVNPPINIAFAEPSLMLGLLATLAGAWLSRRPSGLLEMKLRPVTIVVFAVGLVLAAISSAIFSYDLVGNAPPQEPITGQFTGWENTFFGVVYALAAVGCLLAPWVELGQRWNLPTRVLVATWGLSGLAFLLFSVLNYRTHIGLLINLERGTSYHW